MPNRKAPRGLDTTQIAASNDPFGSRAALRNQDYALQHAKKAKPSSGALKAVARAVAGAHFPDDAYHNAMQRAEGGIMPTQHSLNRISPKQRAVVMKEYRSHHK